MYGTARVLKAYAYGLVLAIASLSALGQEPVKLLRDRSPEQRPALVVLGTAHLHNPGRDFVNTKVEDVLTPARQAEIEAVVEQLAAYRPTHVAVEWPNAQQQVLDTRYKDYREGRYELGASEHDQLGLRLAAKLGLPRVHAVDWNDMPSGDLREYNWFEYGQAHGHQARIAALQDPETVNRISPPLTGHKFAAWLLKLNRAESLQASHRVYFDIAMIGDSKQQPGANWMGHWYGRNLRIFRNLVNLTDRPDDRILVIYGQGHAYLLRQFAQESGAFRLIDLDQVLKER